MKIGIFTDIHSNKEALEIALKALSDCNEIICLGDLCHFGADTNECFEIICELSNFYMVKGNHDKYYISSCEKKKLAGLAPELIDYINFMKEKTNPRVYEFLKNLPYSITRSINGIDMSFTHFSWKKDNSDTESISEFPPKQEQMEKIFKDMESQYIFYGHTHFQHLMNIKRGNVKKCYVNFGSLGVPHNNQGIAKFGSVEINMCGEVKINNYALDYDVSKTKAKIITLNHSYVHTVLNKSFSN